MSVAITSGLLDLSAQKFGMDGLGLPSERVTIRVLVASRDGKKATVFGTYPIRGRHAQISSQRLLTMGTEVNVLAIERYSKKEFVGDFDRLIEQGPWKGKIALKWGVGKISLLIGGQVLQAQIAKMYVAAAKPWVTMTCQSKTLKAAISDEVEIFDKSRRRLNGFKMKGEKLMLKRRFQNSDQSLEVVTRFAANATTMKAAMATSAPPSDCQIRNASPAANNESTPTWSTFLGVLGEGLTCILTLMMTT